MTRFSITDAMQLPLSTSFVLVGSSIVRHQFGVQPAAAGQVLYVWPVAVTGSRCEVHRATAYVEMVKLFR